MSEIAERVGMTNGALYWHLKNKSDLLSKLIKEICLDSESEFTEKFGTPETLADLREYYRKKLVPPDRNDRFMKIHAIMLRRFEWPEDVRSNAFSLLKDQITREKRMINDILIRSQREGTVRQEIGSEEVSSAITSVFYGLFILVLIEIVDDDFSKCSDFICKAFRIELLCKEN